MSSRAAVSALLYAIYALATTGGLLLVKAWFPEARRAWAGGEWWSVGSLAVAAGAALYAVSFLIWLAIVERHPLTIAYPVAIGIAMLSLTAGATLFLRETLDVVRLAGMGLIVLGIVFVVR
jgi:multidrug transporter EmrE-like cation transporter